MIPGIVSSSGAIGLDTPTLSTASGAYGGFTFTITNYDSTVTYVLSTNSGSISRTTNTVTVSGLSNGSSATASVTATKTGYLNSTTATRTGTAYPTCSYSSSYTTTEGGNCGTCGIFGGGQPSSISCYDILHYVASNAPCMQGTTVITSEWTSVGGWYTCGGSCCATCGTLC
jgi:hypothetical protein